MSIEHSTRAITENKYMMQLFADKKSLEADIKALKALKASSPSDPRASDYSIKQKENELSQIDNRIKGKNYTSVKAQCEKYFVDNSTLFDRNQIISETRMMLERGQTVNEWPHLAAVFLIDYANVTVATQANLATVTSQSSAPENKKEDIIIPPSEKEEEPKPLPAGKEEKGGSHAPQQKQDTPPKIEGEVLKVQQKIIFKDGAYYLTGPKGNQRKIEMKELLLNFKLPSDAPENLSKSVSMVEDFSLVLDAYIQANPKEKTKYENTIKSIQELFADNEIQTGKKVLDVAILTRDLFSNSRILLGDTDLRAINSAFRIPDTKDRHLAVLQFIRDRLGQSDLVAQKLIGEVDIGIPSNDALIENNGNIGSNAERRKKIADAIRHAETEAAQDWEKNHIEYEKRFKEMNPGTTWNPTEAKENNKKIRMIFVGKKEFAYQELYNKKDLSGDKALLQDILGAGSMKMSDRSWEISSEVGGLIAMEAIAIAAGVVTAGVGTAAINAAMLGRTAYRGARAIEAYNTVSKTRQVVTTAGRILGSGVGFEAGAATVRSYIENGDFTSMHSKEGYVQSIAMMGAMSGIGKLITAGKFGQGIQFKEGVGFAKNVVPFIGQVAIEGSVIFGTSATIGAVVFDRRDNWTLEQMAQAMLMAAIFKGAGRISARKGAGGNVEVGQRSPSQPQEPNAPRGSARVEPDTYASPPPEGSAGVAEASAKAQEAAPIERPGSPQNRARAVRKKADPSDLKWFKDYFLTEDALIRRVESGEKIELKFDNYKALDGYVIRKKSAGILEIVKPDGTIIRFKKNNLEAKLEQLFNEVHGEPIVTQPKNPSRKKTSRPEQQESTNVLEEAPTRAIQENRSLDELKYFKKYHLEGDNLFDRATRLGASKKIAIEGLDGYKIGKTADGRMLEIEKPDGTKITFFQDQLEAKLEECFRKLYNVSVSPVTNQQSNPEPRTEVENGQTPSRVQAEGTAPKVAEQPLRTNETSENSAGKIKVEEPVANSTEPKNIVDAATAHAVSEQASKTVNQTIAGWTDNKLVKFAWDLATKEVQPGGTIKSVLVFPVNILRLPAINARKIAELWIKKGDKGFEFTPGWENLGNSAKIAATASSKPFEGKTQSLLTLMTIGTVAYMTWQEIHKANPNTPVSLTWGLAVSYLKNMNIALPKEFADWFFDNKINI